MRGWPQGENAGKADTAVPELSHSHSARETAPLRELAAFFLRLGTTAFGGPAAHVALMEDELVRRRAWLSRDKFLDLLGASNLILRSDTSLMNPP